MTCHIVVGKEPSLRLHESGDGFCYASPVELISPTFRNLLQRACKIRIPENLSLFGSFPPGHKCFLNIGILLKCLGSEIEIVGYDLSNRKPVACISYGRLKNVSHLKAAEHLVHFVPAIHTAWH